MRGRLYVRMYFMKPPVKKEVQWIWDATSLNAYVRKGRRKKYKATRKMVQCPEKHCPLLVQILWCVAKCDSLSLSLSHAHAHTHAHTHAHARISLSLSLSFFLLNGQTHCCFKTLHTSEIKLYWNKNEFFPSLKLKYKPFLVTVPKS